MPLGLPVEPDVYRMKSGCDVSAGRGGVNDHSARTSWSAGSDSNLETSCVRAAISSTFESRQPSGTRTVSSMSVATTTTDLASISTATDAGSVRPLLVMSTVAPVSSSRLASDALAVPAATAVYGEPRCLAAEIQTTASTLLGR